MKEILLITNIKNKNNGLNNTYDPTCFDNKIHIRLRNFESSDVIAGFESKLTFTLEYFLALFIKSFPSYSVDFNIKDNNDATKQYIFSKYINEFKQSDAFKEIYNDLNTVVDFIDIDIKPLYSKKFQTTKVSQFGNILDIVDENLLTNNVRDFTNSFNKESIKSFILDDSVSLLITEVNEDNPNEKYLNKNARKIAREIKKGNGYQENKLW